MTVLKAVIATTYDKLKTRTEGDSDIAQLDSVVAGPIGNKLLLRFN